jgi:glycosylphosphatidylinositol transamidase (GPIT) subunit GPI8
MLVAVLNILEEDISKIPYRSFEMFVWLIYQTCNESSAENVDDSKRSDLENSNIPF